MKKARVHVTDHALVCYLEHVRGIDMEAIRQSIARQIDLAADHPGASGVISDCFAYRLKDLTVVSIVPASLPNRRTGKRAGRTPRDE